MRKKAYQGIFKSKDGRYKGYYYDADGKRHQICKKSAEEVYAEIQRRENAIAEGIEEKPITFKEVAEQWEKLHREDITQRTWNNYAPHYQKMISRYGKYPFSEITAQMADTELKRAKAEGRSKTVVRSIRSLWSMIFDFAVVNDYAKYNPILSVKLPKGLKADGKRKSPTNDQFRIIFRNVDAPFGFFALLLLCTGCRKSEALALSWDDVDYEENRIHVTKAVDYTVQAHPKLKTTKTENGLRDVIILPIFLPYLKAYQKKSTNSLLFPNPSSRRGGKGGGLMTGRNYETAWKKYTDQVGLQDITAHHLRHGTATLMLEAGVDPKAAAKSLGHRVQVMEEIYQDLRTDFEQSNIDKLNALMAELMAEKNST